MRSVPCTFLHALAVRNTHRDTGGHTVAPEARFVSLTSGRLGPLPERPSPLRSRYCASIVSSGPLDICLYSRCDKHFKRSGSKAFTMSRQPHGDGQLLGAGQPQRRRGRQGRRLERSQAGVLVHSDSFSEVMCHCKRTFRARGRAPLAEHLARRSGQKGPGTSVFIRLC